MSYGRVVDIVALKTMKMRGQAFIVFEDQVASALALKSLQGFSFFGKPLVNFAWFIFDRESHIPNPLASPTQILCYSSRRKKRMVILIKKVPFFHL